MAPHGKPVTRQTSHAGNVTAPPLDPPSRSEHVAGRTHDPQNVGGSTLERPRDPPILEDQGRAVHNAHPPVTTLQVTQPDLPVQPAQQGVLIPAEAVQHLLNILTGQTQAAPQGATNPPGADAETPLHRRTDPRRHRSPPHRHIVHRSPPRRHRGRGGRTPPRSPSVGSSWESFGSTRHSRSRSSERSYERRPRRRDPPRRYSEDWSPRRDFGRKRKSPFTREIREFRVPRALEKPPSLAMYDGLKNPDEHLDYFELTMQYRGAEDPILCKVFPLTLEKSALAWFRDLRPGSISSWNQLARLFISRFTTSRMKPKSEEVLKAVRQGDTETLREYVERFNKEADNVHNLDDKMRMYFLKDGLKHGSLFHVDIGVNKPKTLGEFLRRSQKYMDYEEADLATRAVSRQNTWKERPPHEQGDRRVPRENRGRDRDYDRRPRRFTEHTRLNTSRAEILAECANAEFRDVKRPDPLVLKEGQLPSK